MALPTAFMVLDALLPARTSAAAIHSASDAALGAWHLPPSAADFAGLAGALTALRAEGLEVLILESAVLSTLDEIDLPVLTRLRAEGGAERWVLLRATQGSSVELQGLLQAETVRVETTEFAARWTGEALVPWRDFEALPHVLEPGQRGDSVRWLQTSLLELGFLSGTPSGVFDTATVRAVREFQRNATLAPDGIVGPRTKIQLYRALPGYAHPLLREPPADVTQSG